MEPYEVEREERVSIRDGAPDRREERVVVRDSERDNNGLGWAVAVLVLVFAIGFGFVAFSNQQSMREMQNAQILDNLSERADQLADRTGLNGSSSTFNIEAPKVEAPKLEIPKIEAPSFENNNTAPPATNNAPAEAPMESDM